MNAPDYMPAGDELRACQTMVDALRAVLGMDPLYAPACRAKHDPCCARVAQDLIDALPECERTKRARGAP